MFSPLSFVAGMTSSNVVHPLLPTSAVFDMMAGQTVIGYDGAAYNNGGLPNNKAVVGGNNTQKTGNIVKDIASALVRFQHTTVVFVDVEGTFNVPRLANEIDRLIGIPGYFAEHVMNKRFFYKNRNDQFDGTAVHNLFKEINEKILQDVKEKKDIYLTTPFPDNEGKPLKIIMPTIIVVDSISEMQFKRVAEHFQTGEVDEGGEKNTRDMKIGNMRRIVYEDADQLGGEAGIFQIWSAQVVDVINMTGRPLEKESTFIRQGKKLKAPKSLMRIPHLGIEIIRGSALKSGQEWLYPDPFGKDIVIDKDAKENPDLVLYATSIFRNKSGGSGRDLFFIGSQSLGIQEGLTMYHAMKTANMFGLEGSAVSHACVLYPECKVGRTTIRKKLLDDLKLERAFVICYQMWFMQTFWLEMDHKYRITPQELYTKLKDKGLDWNNILENTVDYWFDNPAIKKKTVSTHELIRVAIGEREPNWV
jgi:hypothetical protein